jgi:lysine 2,3-aminomutase
MKGDQQSVEYDKPPGHAGNSIRNAPGECFTKNKHIKVAGFQNLVFEELHREITQKNNSPSMNIRRFRSQWYPKVREREWCDWQWQYRNRICAREQFERIFPLTDEERDAFSVHHNGFPAAVTPYYASLIDPSDTGCPLRKAVIPTVHETTMLPGESADPLNELEQSPVPGIIHRYPDRCLFLVTDICASYCRYCTRSRLVGRSPTHEPFTRQMRERAFDYIASLPNIRDVLLSGGDPFMLADESLQYILERLRMIKHIEIIRIGTKTPAVLPYRITSRLTRMLKQYHPLFISIHFTHPSECTPESRHACERLADAGMPLGSQTVLLRGINDSVETMRQLFQTLLTFRVRPYYLYQCDPIAGSAYFRTPVHTGIDIITALRGFTSGYAVPTFVIDAPGGGGKIPISPWNIVDSHDGKLFIRNYRGEIYSYPAPRDTMLRGEVSCSLV